MTSGFPMVEWNTKLLLINRVSPQTPTGLFASYISTLPANTLNGVARALLFELLDEHAQL